MYINVTINEPPNKYTRKNIIYFLPSQNGGVSSIDDYNKY